MIHLPITSDGFSVKENIPDSPGIYKLIAVDNNYKPLLINRFLGKDPDGIIYIGKSDNLRKRLGNM